MFHREPKICLDACENLSVEAREKSCNHWEPVRTGAALLRVCSACAGCKHFNLFSLQQYFTYLYIFTRMPWWRHRPWMVFLHGVPRWKFVTCLSILRAALRLVSSQVALLDLLAVTRRWAKSLERNTEFTAQSLRPSWYPRKSNCPATFSIKCYHLKEIKYSQNKKHVEQNE